MNTGNLHPDVRWHAPFLPCWKPRDGPHPRKRPRTLCLEALLALMTLLMVACTAVQDPSKRWATSGTDPALEGPWVAVEERKKNDKDDPPDALKTVVFAKQAGGYYLCGEAHAEGTGNPFAARTFTVKRKHFMLTTSPAAAKAGFDRVEGGARGGFVWLYEIEGDTLKLKMLDDTALDQAIKAGKITGTRREAAGPKHPRTPEAVHRDDGPSIATLDDATCAALAELTKDDQAWREVARFKRAKAPAPAKK